jgi:hypothetical protein
MDAASLAVSPSLLLKECNGYVALLKHSSDNAVAYGLLSYDVYQ